MSRVHLRLVLTAILAAAPFLAGCGDDGAAIEVPDGPAGDILEQLRGLPEIGTIAEAGTDTPGYRYFRIQFDQPVDHDAPDGPRFRQYVSLIHRDASAPVVMLHTGYGNWYHDIPHQLTWLLQGNQVAVEHRFFRSSRPAGGAGAWQFLTIRQAAADHHRITQALRRVYRGKWLETGASKGGMTSIYHRRFYPGDLDGTVAYVAPLSFGAPDYRYDAHVDGLGPPVCRQAVRDLQVELLSRRRAALERTATEQASSAGHVYQRIALPAAVESAVISLEWAFWQYVGASGCGDVPAVTATDTAVWSFVERVSPVSSSSDAELDEFDAYYYQAEGELGYPGTMDAHLEGLLVFDDAAYAGAYPVDVAVPAFAAGAMPDIDTWVQTEGDRLIFLYGEWDPWSGGMFSLGGATDSLRLVAAQGAHGADLKDLTPGDREQIYGRLAAWTGVTPDPNRLFRRASAPPPPPLRRVPPAIVRALQLRGHRAMGPANRPARPAAARR